MNTNSWRLLICLLFMLYQRDSCSHKFTLRRQILLWTVLISLFITYGFNIKQNPLKWYFNHHC